MSQLVVLNLGQGNCQKGFPVVIAQLWEPGKSAPIHQYTGSLASVPHLPKLYQQWQSHYELLYEHKNLLYEHKNLRHSQHREDDFDFDDDDDVYFSDSQFSQLCQNLKQELNSWLDSCFPNHDSFGKIERQLRAKLNPSDEIRVIIETENHQLRQLPWHLWNFFKDYPLAELAFSTQNFQPVDHHSYRNHFRILDILGNSEGIDIEPDYEILQRLPGAATTPLKEPQREVLTEWLWDQQGWDILCFSGHSYTQGNGMSGRIEINAQESLTIADLKHALNAAIQQGLKLAIFNSCDGLGLAQELADLQIPQLIVMREPVPDRVAHQFLTHFLTAFSEGKSFYLAVREAKEKLQGLETDCPCASWLPVIFQNPSVPCLAWPQPKPIPPIPNPSLWHKIVESVSQSCLPIWQFRRQLLQASVFTTTLVMGIRFAGFLEVYELQAFDHLMRVRPQELPNQHILLVQAFPEDIEDQKISPKNAASLSDHTLLQVFQQLQQYDPVVIGLDIYRDFKVDPEYEQLTSYLQEKNLYGVCKVKNEADLQGIAPSPELASHQLAFSDVVHDPGKVVRRHLFSMKPPDPADPCIATSHLSFLLALHYLDVAHGIEWDYSPQGEIQFKNAKTGKTIILKQLSPYTGGYQRLSAGGRQILLNYHAHSNPQKVAKTLSVTEIIQGIPEQRLEELKNRIVLIGIAGPINSSADYWSTPYSYQQDVPGILIQAQMASQIISAVLDNRPLLWTLPIWQEVLWIWSWSLVGGIVVVYRLRTPFLLVSNSIALITLYGCCYFLILQGGWLPLIPAAISLGLTSIGLIILLYYPPDSSSVFKQDF